MRKRIRTGAPDAVDQIKGRFRRAFAFGLMFALAFGIAFPGLSVWPIVFVALVPLIRVAVDAERPRRAAFAVWLACIPLFLVNHFWLREVTFVGYPLLAMYLALYPALFVWIGARFVRRFPRAPMALIVPVLWVGLEFLRGEIVFHGYPWFLIAHPTIELAPFASAASVFGVYGLGLFVAGVSGAIVDAARCAGARGLVRWLPLAVSVAAVGGVSLLGRLVRPNEPSAGEPVRFGIVQSNVPQSNKIGWTVDQRLADFAALIRLSAEAATHSPPPDVIVWPETMFPGYSLSPEAVRMERDAGLAYFEQGYPVTGFHDELTRFQSDIGTPMLIGAIGAEGLRIIREGRGMRYQSDAIYNSAFIIEDGEVRPERYDKLHLTPFGEVMPYLSAIPVLERSLLAIGARGMSFDLHAGRAPVRLSFRSTRSPGSAQSVRLAIPICFEVTMSRVCRSLVFENGERRAEVLVNLTNDGWFGDSRAGRENHFLNARWRCIELATPMVRAANTGLSGAIDSAGRIIHDGLAVKDREEAVISRAVVPGTRATVFARIGNAPGWLALIGSVGLTLAGFGAPRFKSEPAPEPTKG